MQISKPEVRQIRFDKNLSLINKEDTGLNYKKEYTYYIVPYINSENPKDIQYSIEFRFKLSIYKGKTTYEVVGYLGEAEGFISNLVNKHASLAALCLFAEDVYKQMKKRLDANLVGLDLSYIPKPDYLAMSQSVEMQLDQLGLYR